MSYHARSTRRMYRKSRYNFLATIIIILVLLFVTLNWILPGLINGVGFVKSFGQKPQHKPVSAAENPSLAPPVLSIPFEATNTAQINISGYATADSKVNLYLDDAVKDSVKASDDGSFNFSNVSLSLGTNNIYAKSVDDKGKESLASKLLTVVYDNEKPHLTIDSPEDNKKIQGGDKKVQVSGKTDPGAEVMVNNSQVILGSDGKFSTNLDINEGDNTVDIKAIDTATNSTEIQRKVTFQP